MSHDKMGLQMIPDGWQNLCIGEWSAESVFSDGSFMEQVNNYQLFQEDCNMESVKS
jgi:hypothetical protein